MSDKPDDDVLVTAKKQFEYALSRNSHNVSRGKEDVRFAAASPDDPWQWLETDRNARGQRPTLTINKVPQHTHQVTNDIRMNRPAIKYRPADSKADVKSAEIMMGIARHIEANSDADVAYDTAAENMVDHGTGYVRVLADFVSDQSFDQDIFIRPIYDSFKCHDDPDAMDPAGADRNFFFIEDSLTEEEFKREYPSAEPIDWTFASNDGWFAGSEKKVRIAEYFEVCYREKELLLWPDGSTSFKGDPLPAGMNMLEQPVKTRKTQQRYVMWRKINGQQVLDKKEFPCKWIPVARAIGNRKIVDGKVYVSGLVRNMKDSQRMYNAAQSAIVERVMLAPKSPWLAPIAAIEGQLKTWQTANTGDHSFLPWNHKDDSGEPIPPPSRVAPATVEPGLNQVAQGAAEDIKSETGQYDASLGARSNETSGKAIMARQREGDMSTFHYVDNVARMVRHVGRIVLDMAPKIYDTQRIARILGEDGKPDNVQIDPRSPQALIEQKDEQGAIQRIFNPQIGTYDVYTTTGPSFTTRRQEAVEAMTQMTQANPELWQVIGDKLVAAMDWPGAEEMAKRLKAVLLPQVRDAEDGGEVPPEVKAQMQQMGQQMQQLVATLEEASAKVRELESSQAMEFNKLLIDAYGKETDRLKVVGGAMTPEAVQAIVVQLLQDMANSPEPLAPDGMQPPDQMVPMNPNEPPQGGFFMPEEGAITPPEMAATGANPGLGLPPILEEGTPSV